MPHCSPSASIHLPTPLPFASTTSALPLTRANKLSTGTAGSQPEEVPLDASDSQLTESQRPCCTRAPTERGALLRDDMQRSHALSAKIWQTKALNAAGPAQGTRKGQSKRHLSPRQNQASGAEAGDVEDSDPNTDDDGYESSVVPTSDPCERFEQVTSETYQGELADPEFRCRLSDNLQALVKDTQKTRQYSCETLLEALRLVRRGPSVPNGAAQWNTSVLTLPVQSLNGGSGYHQGNEPQLGEKQRFDATVAESSKHVWTEFSRTPSTVLENTPPMFATAAMPVAGMPKGLPRTKALHIPDDDIWGCPSRSPSPLPASFRFAFDNSQMVPEDTQTVPDDTQTVPEDTQTMPEPIEPEATSAPAPPSPDLGSPPQGHQSSRNIPRLPSTSSSISLGGYPTPPALPSSTGDNTSPTGSQAKSSRAQQLEEMAVRFDRNEHNHACAYEILSKQKGSQRSLNVDDGIMEEDAADRADTRKNAKGKPVKRKPKTGLNCQPGRPRQVATRAVTDLSAYSIAIGPYIFRQVYLMLSMPVEAYKSGWVVEFPGIPIEQAIPELLAAIADRAPGAWTVVKRNLQPIMISKNGYGFNENPASQKEIDANIALYKSLHKNFHFGPLTNPDSHYEHPALEAGYVRAFFKDRHSPCAVDHHCFAPAVTPQSIGFLLTLMESCIAEWRTGRHVDEDLNSSEQLVMYKKHMRNLKIFAKGAPGRFKKMHESFYEAGCRQSVRENNSDTSDQATIRIEDIHPDSPSPVTGTDTGDGSNV